MWQKSLAKLKDYKFFLQESNVSFNLSWCAYFCCFGWLRFTWKLPVCTLIVDNHNRCVHFFQLLFKHFVIFFNSYKKKKGCTKKWTPATTGCARPRPRTTCGSTRCASWKGWPRNCGPSASWRSSVRTAPGSVCPRATWTWSSLAVGPPLRWTLWPSTSRRAVSRTTLEPSLSTPRGWVVCLLIYFFIYFVF